MCEIWEGAPPFFEPSAEVEEASKQLELSGRLFAIEQNVSGKFVRRTDADLFELDELGQLAAASRADDRLGADFADAGYAHKLLAFCPHDLDRLVNEVFVCPCLLGIDICW